VNGFREEAATPGTSHLQHTRWIMGKPFKDNNNIQTLHRAITCKKYSWYSIHR